MQARTLTPAASLPAYHGAECTGECVCAALLSWQEAGPQGTTGEEITGLLYLCTHDMFVLRARLQHLHLRGSPAAAMTAR